MKFKTRLDNKVGRVKREANTNARSISSDIIKPKKSTLNNRFNKKTNTKYSSKVSKVKNISVNNKRYSNYKYLPPIEAKDICEKNRKDKIWSVINSKIRNQANKIKLEGIKEKITLPKNNIINKRPTNANAKFTNIKNSVFGVSKKLTKKLEKCYDLTMHYASLHDFRHEKLVGVDITPNCIYLCQIDALNGKRVLTSLTSVCMEGRFLTQDIADNTNQYAQSLKDLVAENNIKTKNVALSIPVSNSIVRTVTIPTLKDKEIEKALKYGSLWNNIMSQDSNPDDYSIFYQIIRRNKSSHSMDVLFIATKLSDVNIYTKVVKDSGLNPVIVDIRSFAVSNAYNHKLNNPKASGSCVFLEFGLEENYAMLINQGQANIKQINVREIHRMAITEDSLDEGIINEFALNYSSQVRKIINDYQDSYDIEYIDNLLVLSVVPRVKEIVDILSDYMGEYDIQECNFFDCMKINDDFTISGESAKQNISAWAASIGAALRKVDIFGNNTANKKYPNMLPKSGEYAFVKRANYALYTFAMIATVAITYVSAMETIKLNEKGSLLSQELAKYEGVKESHASLSENYNNISNQSQNINSVIALMKEAGESQQRILSVYKYMNLVILDDVWLREIKFVAPDKIEVVGGADNDRSIIEFMQLLNEGNQFSNVSLKGMKEIREVSVRHADVVNVKTFKLESTLSDIPVYDFHDVNQMAGEMNSGS
jgi:type IV pilus assembly protein PilN